MWMKPIFGFEASRTMKRPFRPRCLLGGEPTVAPWAWMNHPVGTEDIRIHSLLESYTDAQQLFWNYYLHQSSKKSV